MIDQEDADALGIPEAKTWWRILSSPRVVGGVSMCGWH